MLEEEDSDDDDDDKEETRCGLDGEAFLMLAHVLEKKFSLSSLTSGCGEEEDEVDNDDDEEEDKIR